MRPCSRAGLTLIEVVAAVAILGTILVGVVLARSRHTHQLALAGRQRQVVRVADELIAGWWAGSGVPINASGKIPGHDSLFWKTRETSNRAINKLGARVVRVELREARESRSADALVRVDLVLPKPFDKTKTPVKSAKATGRAQS